MKPVLIGESNPYSMDPADAMLPFPERSAGHRLCVLMGCSRSMYLATFERRNLIDDPRWSLPQARRRSGELAREFQCNDLILLGARVASAFGIVYRPWLTHPRYGTERGVVIVIPHPSGRSRGWLEPGARDRLRLLMRPYLEPAGA